MKICHLTSAHSSDDVRIFRKECVSLAKAGHEVYLVAKGESREEAGVRVLGLGEVPAGRLSRMTKFAAAVYRKALEVDAEAYHLHDPELLPYALKLKKRGKKVIFDSHENYPEQIMEKRYLHPLVRSLISRLFKAYETHVLKRIDAVIIPCTFDGKNVFENRAKRTVFIANYPILDTFYQAYDPDTEKEYDICYCGGMSYQRGVYHLVKAAGMAGKRLLLAGWFSGKKFEEELRALPEFACADYVGRVDNRDIPALVQKSRVGANTLLNLGQYTRMDTFGIKVYEYMSVGLPVLLADNAYSKAMAEKYGFGVCASPDDPEDVARALEYLLEEPQRARQMGLNGRKAVESEFNWSTQEKNLFELYASLQVEK